LSITLLATVAHHNKWDYDLLAREWDTRRTQVLRTDYSNSLAATIELSLVSPMFQELGPDARGLLGVVAFFPQGIDESNFDRFSPTTSDRGSIFGKFCILSLTYRRDGFITMLAPLQDYLCPKDPTSSPLLRVIRECYLRRLLAHFEPSLHGYEEARWIVSEDVNVEHLLDVFTSIDTNSDEIWDARASFMRHLYWHKPRLVVLGPKIEGLPDDHPSKPECLLRLSRLFDVVGNTLEYKRILVHTLQLWRERGDDLHVAITLRFLAHANRQLFLSEEGILQAKESLEFAGVSMMYRNRHALCRGSLCCCVVTSSSTPQKRLHPDQSISSQTADNSRSAKATVSLATYVAPRVRQKRPSTTSRQPSGSLLL
jgi:hypothetical protein